MHVIVLIINLSGGIRMSYLLSSLLTPALIAILVYGFIRIRQFMLFRYYVNKFPGPPTSYIFGNALQLFGSSEKIFKTLRQIASKYKIYRLWVVTEAVVCITLPADIEAIIATTNNITKSKMYLSLEQFLGTGLLISDGSKWHVRRKILTPAFHFKILQEFVDVFVKHAKGLADELEKCENDSFVDIVPYITTFTLSSICETAMGTPVKSNSKEQVAYKEAINKANKYAHMVIVDALYHYFITRIFMPPYWQQKFVVRSLHSFTNRVIKERKATFRKSTITNDDYSIKKRLAMLDLLLSVKEENGGIDDEGIREEVDTFMFEGHDTTSMGLCFLLMLLANHSEIQERVFMEVMDVLGHENREPTYNDLQNLHYLEACIKESLRLYPSVPLISRITTVDIQLPSGYFLPKGTPILVQIYDLHHNPDIFSDPETYNPDRFLPENCVNRHPFAYLPFSGGPRNCIGQKFALLELKAAVSAIIRKFILEPVDTPETVKIAQEIVLRPKGGLKVKLKSRTRNNLEI